MLSSSQGSVYGAFQGYARAFYAEFIPPGEEARWYGLFSITDKVSVSHLVVDLERLLTPWCLTVELVRRPAHRRTHR